MGKLKSLASDTVVYGVSTILSRLIGWLMMPLYTHVVSQSVYGTFSYIYSYIAIFLVVVTLGFETGYFRFVTDENVDRLLGSLSTTVFNFGLLLMLSTYFFPSIFLRVLDFDFGPNSPTYLVIMMSIVLLDSYNSIFFAELRYQHRSVTYALLRLAQVVVTVVLTVFFLFFLRGKDGFLSSFDDISYMMFANLLGSFVSTLWFLPRAIRVCRKFDPKLLSTVFFYCLPLVGMGFFGQANMNIEKILIKHLDTSADPLAQLGIYSASYKVGVLMSIFTQSFRIAFEPFFFRENKEKSDTQIYADALKYFVYFGLLIFAGVILFQPLIYLILPQSYAEGYVILPYILIGQLFFGVYYSLSLWYKVTDRTYWGIIMSAIGLIVNTLMNYLLIPQMGYMGAAVSTLVGYFVMMFLSYVLGQKYYPIAYPVLKISCVSLLVIALVIIGDYLIHNSQTTLWPVVSVATLLLVLAVLLRSERLTPAKLLSLIRPK